MEATNNEHNQQIIIASMTAQEADQLRKMATNMLSLLNTVEDRGTLTLNADPQPGSVADQSDTPAVPKGNRKQRRSAEKATKKEQEPSKS